jgi:hypothetical protein
MDMMKQLYKDSLTDITVSHELIDKTRLLMKQRRDNTQKRTTTMRYASIAVCFAVVLLTVVVFPKLKNQIPSNNNPSNTTLPASNLLNQQSNAPNANSKIYINQLGNMIKEQPVGAGPAVNRIEKWTFKKYCDLLGFNPLPAKIPQGLSMIENDAKDVYFMGDRRVDFYNTWRFVYKSGSEENAKSITVNVNPTSIPYWSVPRAYQLKGHG